MSYSNIKKSNEENFDLLVQCICSYREEDDIIYLNNALKSFESITLDHSEIDNEDYNIILCALATDISQSNMPDKQKTSLELYNRLPIDPVGVKIENLNMLRRILCFDLCISNEGITDEKYLNDTIDKLYKQILKNPQGIDEVGLENLVEAYYIFKKKNGEKHFLVTKSNDKEFDKSMQQIHSKELIPERSIDFNSALNMFKKLTGEKVSMIQDETDTTTEDENSIENSDDELIFENFNGVLQESLSSENGKSSLSLSTGLYYN